MAFSTAILPVEDGQPATRTSRSRVSNFLVSGGYTVATCSISCDTLHCATFSVSLQDVTSGTLLLVANVCHWQWPARDGVAARGKLNSEDSLLDRLLVQQNQYRRFMLVVVFQNTLPPLRTNLTVPQSLTISATGSH